MDSLEDRLRDNVQRVRAAIEAAARRSGRGPEDVTLVAVTKYAPLDAVRRLPAAGVVDLGENRVAQLVERAGALADAHLAPRWHMIGHLQRNKVRDLLSETPVIHSLDSQRLATELQSRAAALGKTIDVFIEVNAGEAEKSGLSPAELDVVAAFVAAQANLRLLGLMTMAPLSDDAEASRPVFAGLRAALESLRRRGLVPPSATRLSMGMSQDYATAVEEGATHVRIGSALFEGLPTSDPRGT